jgi:excisionase family DNA binding protein
VDEQWLTVEQIGEQLQVSGQTVRRWLRIKDLPGLNLGGKAGYRVRRTDLEQFIAKRLEGKAAA